MGSPQLLTHILYTIFYCLCQMKKPQKSAEIWGYFLGGVRNFYLYNANIIVPTIIIVINKQTNTIISAKVMLPSILFLFQIAALALVSYLDCLLLNML